MPEAVIVATSRTPIGRAVKGSLADVRPDDMSAFIIEDVLGKVPQIDGADVEDVMWGCAQPAGEAGYNIARLSGLLAGLDVPSAGQAYVNKADLLALTEQALVDYRREEVGFVWQQTGRNLIPYLNAQQNIEVPMILAGRPRKFARERALELLEAVGLMDKRQQRPDQLSGGEQQRVSIGVALANDPPLLLADEPTGELDTHTSEEIFRLFRNLSNQYGLTIVIVTHDPAIAARVDRVVAIRDGSIATETVRRVENPGTEIAEVVHEEFAVVDGAGRLQIPKPLLEQVALGRRAYVDSRDGRIVITPAHEAVASDDEVER